MTSPSDNQKARELLAARERARIAAHAKQLADREKAKKKS